VHQTSRSNLLFVFSSSSFNEAVRRVQYVKAYTAFRRAQAGMIEQASESLHKELKRMEDSRNERAELLAAELRNRSELNREKTTVSKQVDDFKKQESKFTAEVKEKEKAAEKLNKQIKAMIAAAIKEQEKKSAATTSGSSSAALASTREARELSNQFAANKGKLPWPVEKGTICGQFGKRYLPELKMSVENNGIDILTERSATVRAIFNGEVINTFYSPVFHYGVLISHGSYFTVYTGLEKLTVKENDKVSTKQPIGTAFNKNEAATTEVHLEVWQGTTKLNPALWLYQ